MLNWTMLTANACEGDNIEGIGVPHMKAPTVRVSND